MQSLPRKFNPGLNQDDQSLIDQYVVRLPLLATLLETIKGNTDKPICQHCLYYAPRGGGKTMLMARVAAELRSNTEFSEKWIAIRLLEESYYEVSSMAEFWLEVMSELSLHLPDEYKSNAKNELKVLQQNWAQSDLEQTAQATVFKYLDVINKKAVIMVENLHQLLEEADKGIAWSIRKLMETEPRIMFLATATTCFNTLDNAEHPFFESFITVELPPLNRSEATVLWNALTKSRRIESDIAPLVILTGGSPRLLNIVAQFSKNNSIRELMENLTGLVDEYTEYFKSQLDSLAPKERRVFLALTDLWAESSAKEVAERARMEIRTTSALLGRLEHKGALKVNADNPRKKSYLVAERLFCIYYKLRRERSQEAVIESLVQFMIDFYTPQEIESIKLLHLTKASLLWEESSLLEKLTELSVKKDLETINKLYQQAGIAYQQDKFSLATSTLELIITQYHEREEAEIIEQVVKALHNQAVVYGQQQQLNKALTIYQSLINSYQKRTETGIIILIAKAIYNQAVTYRQLGKVAKELEGYIQLISLYSSTKEPEIIEKIVIATINIANQFAIEQKWKEAEINYQAALFSLNGDRLPQYELYTSTASLGTLLAKQAGQLSDSVQSSLVDMIKQANQHSPAEERMALAIGIGAILPVEMALPMIQESLCHQSLSPLIIALQLKKGDKVRVSEEALEVAGDVDLRMKQIAREGIKQLGIKAPAIL